MKKQAINSTIDFEKRLIVLSALGAEYSVLTKADKALRNIQLFSTEVDDHICNGPEGKAFPSSKSTIS